MKMRRSLSILTFLMLAVPAFAADAPPPPKLEPVPDIPPPPGVSDVEMEPQVTITHRGTDKIEEYRIKGRLTMIKVTPRIGKPYYLVPRPDGQFMRRNDLSPNFVVPMWMIKEF
jgi:hypothetical protein